MHCCPWRSRLAGCAHPQLLGPFLWVCEQEGLFRGFQKPPHTQRRASFVLLRDAFSPSLTPPYGYQPAWGPSITAVFLERDYYMA